MSGSSPAEQLLPEVVDEVAVVAGEVVDDARRAGPTARRGPARRGTARRASPRSARRARRGRPVGTRRRARAKSVAASRSSNASSAGSDLDDAPPDAEPSEGSGIAVRPASTMLDPAASRATSTGSDVEDVAADELVDVVEHEDERARRAASMAPNCCSAGEPIVGDSRPQRRHASRIHGLDVVERQRHVGEQRGRVVRRRRVSDTHAVGRGSSGRSSATNVDLP